MPTYEYECTNCGHRFDLFQSITAAPLRRMDTPCEQCGRKAPVRRLISGGGAILFKGNGFYETDYRSEAYKKAAKAESGGDGKVDTKPEAKSDAGTKNKTQKSQTKPENRQDAT